MEDTTRHTYSMSLTLFFKGTNKLNNRWRSCTSDQSAANAISDQVLHTHALLALEEGVVKLKMRVSSSGMVRTRWVVFPVVSAVGSGVVLKENTGVEGTDIFKVPARSVKDFAQKG